MPTPGQSGRPIGGAMQNRGGGMPARTGSSGGMPPSRGSSMGGGMGGGMPPRGGGMGGTGGMGARGGGMGGSGMGGAGLGNRRDVTEKKEKPIYYSQLNFDETSNDYMMTKVTIGTLVVLVILTVLAVFLNWGVNAFIGLGIAYLFWGFYFFSSLVMKPRMAYMPYKDKKNYWTYELTNEYKDRNVVLNDFKRNIGTVLIKPNDKVLIDDVSVELMSYDPLIFDFAIRSRIKKEDIMRTVPTWSGQFDCATGSIVSTGINQYRVVYPRKNQWETLAGKKISANDAVGETHEPTIDRNPIGIRTDNYQEIYIDNSSQHTVVTGKPGTGKSNMFNMILVNQFPTDAIILFFDGKGDEYSAGSKRWFPVITIEQAEAWVAAIKREMSPTGRRSKAKAAAGAKKFLPAEKAASDPDAIPFSPDFPPIIIAVDECHSWCDMKDSSKAGFARDFRAFLTSVAEKGRSHGITLLMAAQSPRDESIPASAVNLAHYFIAFQQTSAFEQNAFGGTIDYKACAPSEIPDGEPQVGQFAFAGPGTSDKTIPAKGYFIQGDIIEKQAELYSNKKRTNNPMVADAMKIYAEKYAKAKNKDELPPTLF